MVIHAPLHTQYPHELEKYFKFSKSAHYLDITPLQGVEIKKIIQQDKGLPNSVWTESFTFCTKDHTWGGLILWVTPYVRKIVTI